MSTIRNKRRAIIVCAGWIIFIFPLAASAAMLDFKGLPMGASEALAKKKFPSLFCGDIKGHHNEHDGNYDPMVHALDGDRYCKNMDNVSIAGIHARNQYLSFYSDQLSGILFVTHSSEFATIADALTVKYGGPSKIIPMKLQNALGASWNNDLLIWQIGDNKITAMRYLYDLDTSIIKYISGHGERETARREKRSTKNKSKDL